MARPVRLCTVCDNLLIKRKILRLFNSSPKVIAKSCVLLFKVSIQKLDRQNEVVPLKWSWVQRNAVIHYTWQSRYLILLNNRTFHVWQKSVNWTIKKATAVRGLCFNPGCAEPSDVYP